MDSLTIFSAIFKTHLNVTLTILRGIKQLRHYISEQFVIEDNGFLSVEIAFLLQAEPR